MDKSEIAKIAFKASQDIINQYHKPQSIVHGLSESMGEENAAAIIYRNRAEMAALEHDHTTAKLYEHIAKEEETHLEELGLRALEIIGVREPATMCKSIAAELQKTHSGFDIYMDRQGNIHVSHPAYKEDVFLQFESDKDLIYDLLKPDEKEEMDKGWHVSIEGSEPRASILSELFAAQPVGCDKSPAMDISFTTNSIRHKIIDGILVVKPTRKDIENLKVGDYAPNPFGKFGKVNEITYHGTDIHGKIYVGYYVQWHGEGSSISESLKEEQILMTVPMTSKWSRAESVPW